MSLRKYIFVIFGTDAQQISNTFVRKLELNDIILEDSNTVIHENRRYDTGLPLNPTRYADITLHIHGIIFLENTSIDALSNDRESYIKGIISNNLNDLRRIPKSILNGSYVGIAIDHKNETIYAFTSFLNSIPLYYATIDDSIVISTDLEYLAKTINAEYSVNQGVLEYYANGTNISDSTAFPLIKSIPKGAILEYCQGKITVDYYYTMTTEISNLGFDEHLEQFAELWAKTLNTIHSDSFKYGLGFTGGIDSRLILAAMPNRSKPLLFTGSHPDHPDVLLATYIAKSMGLQNHVMEDYRDSDKVRGYAMYTAMADNPFHCNSLYFYDQMKFREDRKLVYEIEGLTEFLGGVYHYSDRRSIGSAFKMALPPTQKRLKLHSENILRILSLGLRNSNLSQDFSHFSCEVLIDYRNEQLSTFKHLLKQIGPVNTEEAFLERFRHIHKMANLLTWAVLPGRRFNEHLSPSMNIEMTDFVCKVPLSQRDSRKLILAYLKKFHSDLAGYVMSGYFLSANSPWMLYKILAPHVKVLNHLGVRIPKYQWYLKKHDYKAIGSNPLIYKLQEAVCRDSSIIMKTEFASLLKSHINDKTRLMRMYNIALFEKKMSMNESELYDYLCTIIDAIQ